MNAIRKTGVIYLLIFIFALCICPASAADTGTISIVSHELGTTSADYNVITYSGSVSNDNFTTFSWDFGDSSSAATDISGTHTYSGAGTYTLTFTATSTFDNTTITADPVTVTVTVVDPTEEPTALPASTIAIDSITVSGTTWTNYKTITCTPSITGGTASAWTWNFGDSTTSSGSSATHTYSQAGTYTVTLTATSSDSTISNSPVTQTVTITEPPLVASFDIDLDDEELTYDSTTTGSVSWNWNFGDGSTHSTLDNGSHIYTEPGGYTVTLTAKSPVGNTSTYTENIELNMLMAYFTADIVSGSAPLTVTFKDDSSENPDTWDDIVEWRWDFDDGTADVVNDDDSDVKHTFEDEGVYDVILTVKDEDGDTDPYKVIITVDDDVAPTADFDLYSDDYDTEGKVPFTVRFIDESEPSEETNSTIIEWHWEFINEDDTVIYSSWSQNPPSYTFSDAGLYTIQLTVTDEDGATDTEIKEDYIEVTLALSATFTATPTSGYSPLTVSFTATDGSSNDYDIDTYHWVFGDGYTSSTTTRTTSHTYTSTGTYTVKLTVTDEESNTYTSTRENYITVTDISSVTAAPTYTIAPTSPENTVITTDASAGTKIFGLPGTEFVRSEMSRFYGFYDEYLKLLTGIFGMN